MEFLKFSVVGGHCIGIDPLPDILIQILFFQEERLMKICIKLFAQKLLH